MGEDSGNKLSSNKISTNAEYHTCSDAVAASPGPADYSSPSSAATTGATASSATKCDGDLLLATRLRTMETLTDVFRFNATIAQRAMDAIDDESDVTSAYNWILDHGYGQDNGGPMIPVTDCPHVLQHVKIAPDDIDLNIFTLDCEYHQLQRIQQKNGDIGNNAVVELLEDSAAGQRVGEGENKIETAKMVTANHHAYTEKREMKCNSKENWLCLECSTVRCSRYVEGHGLAHWEDTKGNLPGKRSAQETKNEKDDDNHTALTEAARDPGHCLAASLSDLSVWCHACGAYVRDEAISHIVTRLEAIKFGNVKT